MVITSNYEVWSDKKGRVHIRSKEKMTCPKCQGKLTVRDSKPRGVKFKDETEKTKLIIRRLYCKNCDSLHSELPDTVIPYKRHARETVEAIIDEEAEALSDEIENSTINRIRRWWRGVFLYFQSIMVSLKAKYGMEFSPNPKMAEIVRAVVNAHMWIHTRSAYVPNARFDTIISQQKQHERRFPNGKSRQ